MKERLRYFHEQCEVQADVAIKMEEEQAVRKESKKIVNEGKEKEREDIHATPAAVT